MRDARLWLRRPPRRLLSTAAKPKYLRSRERHANRGLEPWVQREPHLVKMPWPFRPHDDHDICEEPSGRGPRFVFFLHNPS